MSVAENLIIDDGTVASSINASGFRGVDPRRRRFGYNPGIYLMEMEPRESGRQQRIIPEGVLVPFKTAPLTAENFEINVDIDQYQKEVIRDFEAAWFINNVRIAYEGKGFRELGSLTVLENPEAYALFNLVHPTFEELELACPFNLQNCVTCRLSLLGENEFSVSETIQERLSSLPDMGAADGLLAELRDALTTFKSHATEKWASLLGELTQRKDGEPGISKLGPAEHHLRRHLHEHPPEAQGAIVAASFGAEASRAQEEGFKQLAEAFRENKSGANEEVLVQVVSGLQSLAQGQQTLAERQAKTDEVLAQTSGVLAQLAERILNVTETAPAPPSPETPAPKAKK